MKRKSAAGDEVVKKSRRVLRKEKRIAKKKRRQEYNTRKSKSGRQNIRDVNAKSNYYGNGKKSDVHTPDGGYVAKFRNSNKVKHVSNSVNVNDEETDSSQQVDFISKKVKPLKSMKLYKDPLVVRKSEEEADHLKLMEEMQKVRNEQLHEANEEEERVIKKLEKQLNMSRGKRKSVPKCFTEDGLDYLLDVCDGEKIKRVACLEKKFENSDSELEEDLALAMSGRMPEMSKNKVKCVPSSLGETNSSDFDSDEDDNFVTMSENGDNVSYKNDDKHESISEDCEHFSNEDGDGTISQEMHQTDVKGSRVVKVSQQVKRTSNVAKVQCAVKKSKITTDSSDEPGRFVKLLNSEESDCNDKDSDISAEVDFLSEKNDDSLWEDIYGRTRDKNGNIVKKLSNTSAYVPPALRAQQSTNTDDTLQRLKRLKRQVKGYLNRLTEQNLPSISSEMDQLYSNNSRNDMNTTFTSVLIESIITPVLSLERLVMEHVALVACLHSKVGSDVGAYVLQTIIRQFDSLFKRNPNIEDKELDNVVLIICYLYQFKVVHSRLLYDILHLLSDRFGSKDLELILLMLRTVGFGVRKDNPTEMKSLMIKLQELANKSLKECNESRVKFMLEILVAVKNNNVTRLPGWNPSPVENMRKLLRGLLASGNTSSELNISLQDLLEADERGRWWVVGSAWAGQAPGNTDQPVKNVKSNFSAEILELADRMRMNTEVRRNIFCILMSAQDFTEAFSNLMRLGLKGIQAREMVHITLECCLQEKKYNKFYAFVLQSFCDHHRVFRMTLQHDLWNKIEEIQGLAKTQFSNMVMLLQQLLSLGVLNLLVFKCIDLVHIEKPIIRLLRQVLLGILAGDLEKCNLVFMYITKNAKHKLFCQRLHLFLQQFVLHKMTPDDPQKEFMRERVDGIFMSQTL